MSVSLLDRASKSQPSEAAMTFTPKGEERYEESVRGVLYLMLEQAEMPTEMQRIGNAFIVRSSVVRIDC